MAQTAPRPPADPSRYHHEQGAQHHLDRIFNYTGGMKNDFRKGQLPSMTQALQVSADLARYIGHLSALIEHDVLAARPPVPRRNAKAA